MSAAINYIVTPSIALLAAAVDAIAVFFISIDVAFVEFCVAVFQRPLRFLFAPIDALLNPIYQPWATIVAVGFFVAAMLWVGLILKESYVNLERPRIAWYTDLRIWTVVSMLPHVFVYFYFM